MKLGNLLEGIEVIEITAQLDTPISGVCCDSRRCGEGMVFTAITGFVQDGHSFITAAKQLGAAVVVCERKPDCDIPYVIVKNSRKALALMSAKWYNHPADGMCLIGVTGTNGKTTTTYLIKTILEKTMNAKVGLIGTNQNMIGEKPLETAYTTPESNELQRLLRQMADEGCTHVVMEVSSHALSLSRVDGIKFDIGIFTNLTQDHLDFYKDMDEYAAAKAELFRRCKVGIINIDDKWSEHMTKDADCEVFSYSTEKNEADLVAKNINLKPNRVEFEALLPYHIDRVSLGIPGAFSVYNALAAIAAALNLGIELSHIAASLKSAKGVKGRVEVVPTPGKDYTVIIDYAHTPDALENILRAVKGFAPGRVVLLFGCGGDRDTSKRPIMAQTAAKGADYLVVTSDNPRTEKPSEIIDQIIVGLKGTKTPYKIIEDRRQAIKWAMDNAKNDDIIILAGKGHETYQILGTTKTHFDEREEVAKNL